MVTGADAQSFPVASAGKSAQDVPDGTLAMRTQTLTQSAFRDAAIAWLDSRRPYISAKTFHEYELNINTLSVFFGELRLIEIDADLIRKYQRIRTTQGCGPSGVNHETSVLQQMLKRVGVWPTIAPEFQPLPLPKWQPGRIISEIEKQRLLRIAANNPEWQAAYLFAALSVNTTCGPKEVATLRLRDVDLEQRTISVQPEGAKNAERVRTIKLNQEALAAARAALERAKSLGAAEPDHYLFPFRVLRNKFDPTRNQTTFKTAWKKMTVAAKLGGLRMYDLRRTCITNLLTNPKISEETVSKIAGHVNRNMLKRYSYQRLDKIQEAVDALLPQKAPTRTPRKKPPASEEDTARALLLALAKILKTG